MASINAAAVLQQFDKLIAQGELFYHPTKPTFQTDEGFEFEFRICPSFKSKPQFSSVDSSGHVQTAQSARRPPPTDGSDIDHSDPAFFVANFRQTHKLILNKFCVFRPQHLLLTLDPKCRQDELLDEKDFAAAWAALRTLDGNGEGVKHYVVYNGGKEAGSSRRHKHMQLLAQPSKEDGDLELVGYNPDQVAKLPCVAYFVDLKGWNQSGEVDEDDGQMGKRLAEIAREHYRLSREAMGATNGEADKRLPHNVMLTRDWMITVPRRTGTIEGKLEGHVVGCQGVLGSVWVTNEKQLTAWKEFGPANVVRELCVPKKS